MIDRWILFVSVLALTLASFEKERRGFYWGLALARLVYESG